MSGIFISYRREESEGYAGRLRDRLVQEFGQEHVFMDVDTIEPGVDFIDVVEKAVAAVDVLLCVIGKKWLTIEDKDGNRRLENPTDLVRLEVAAALKRNIRVIPVLVWGATMPSANELPSDLSTLTRRNAVELHHTGFHAGVNRLVDTVKKQMGDLVDDAENQDSDEKGISGAPDLNGTWGTGNSTVLFTGVYPNYDYVEYDLQGQAVGQGRAVIQGNVVRSQGFNPIMGQYAGQFQLSGNMMMGNLANPFGNTVPVRLVRQ